MRTVIAVVGALLTIWVFVALVQLMLVPRQPSSLLAKAISSGSQALWMYPARHLRSYRRRDAWLSGVAPAIVLTELVVYVALLILTLGLVIYGTTALSMADALYQSGATFTTLGIVEPVTTPSVVATYVSALLGLVVIALFIGYLMALYSAFVERESGMARLSLLAGEPAWGPIILIRSARLGMTPDSTPNAQDWISWTCDVRLNHQVNPVLSYLRSPGRQRHWTTTLLAVLDAAALRVSLNPTEKDPELLQLIVEGTITFNTLDPHTDRRTHNWEIEQTMLTALESTPTRSPPSVGLTQEEFDEALELMRLAGVPIPDGPEEAWFRFAAVRAIYFSHAASLALRFHAIPAPWSGLRKPPLATIWPELKPETGVQK